ncbi:MAG: hypothetical protein LBT00_01590 [Spirochaetaceae bacterium]|nr:hypothetical protein [Spirochaetaceae bacterium]
MEAFLVWIASPTATMLPRVRNDGAAPLCFVIAGESLVERANPSSLRVSPSSLRAERSNPVDDRFVWIASPFGFAMTGPPRYASSLRVSPSLR